MLREGTDIATLEAIVIVWGLAIYQAWRLEVAMEKGLGKVEAAVKKVEAAVERVILSLILTFFVIPFTNVILSSEKEPTLPLWWQLS